MVLTKKRQHVESTAQAGTPTAPAAEPADETDPPAGPVEPASPRFRTTRDIYDALPPLPGLRAQIIEGTLIVSPVGTPEHGWHAMALSFALYEVMAKNDWRAYAGNVDICIDGPRDPVLPDYVLAPKNCRRWGDRELLSSDLVMVAEVVSPGSARLDREDKPRVYAKGGVPVFLLIDPLTTSPSITVFSDIDDGAYQTLHKVAVGTPLHLPDPVNFELDTSIFK
jgi:Uma2 family endonuclease